MTKEQMWIKLYNVVDSVCIDTQRKTAYTYAELWLAKMIDMGHLSSDLGEQYALAIITLAERDLV